MSAAVAGELSVTAWLVADVAVGVAVGGPSDGPDVALQIRYRSVISQTVPYVSKLKVTIFTRPKMGI